jgi:hypothetical protein
MILPGMYNLTLPVNEFNKKGIYTVYIKPKEIRTTIENVGPLYSFPSVKGIILKESNINGLSVFAARHNIPVYGAPGTILALKQKGILNEKHIDNAFSDEHITIAGMNIQPIRTSHDCADGRGYIITGCDGVTKVAIATDTGFVSNELLSAMTGCKLAYIESNHDVNMLKTGPYYYDLKKRILSDIPNILVSSN